MEVIENIFNIDKKLSPTVIALGYFDGIHLGHQKLITTVKEIALKKNFKSAIFTFMTHPLSILSTENTPKLLSSNRTKIEIIESIGIDYMIFPKFSEDIMNIPPETFIKDILVKVLNVKHVVVGFNYKFGYKGTGNSDTLVELGKKHGFEVTIIEPVTICEKIISSTLIRELIQNGMIKEVNKYLGRAYSVKGKVVPGKGLGKKLSIPTANLKVNEALVLPKSGVYHTSVLYNNSWYNAVTSIGLNPTFKNHPMTIETYILDFNKNIYDKEIEVFFLDRIRSEIKFKSLDELVAQIKKDIEFAKKKNFD